MRPNDAIKHMLSTSGQSASGVSKAIGKHRTHLSVAFDRGTVPRVDTFAAIAHECGYRLYVEGEDKVEVMEEGYDYGNQRTAD